MDNDTFYTSKEGKETFELALLDLSKKSTSEWSFKSANAKWTDLGEVLKDNPLRVFVQRTTRRTVAPRAGGFRFHVIKTPAPVYLFTNGYDPDFKKKKQKREDDITMIKAQIEYAKLREQAGTKLGHRRQ